MMTAIRGPRRLSLTAFRGRPFVFFLLRFLFFLLFTFDRVDFDTIFGVIFFLFFMFFSVSQLSCLCSKASVPLRILREFRIFSMLHKSTTLALVAVFSCPFY